MTEAEERLAHYLAKAEEDPYSQAIIEVAKEGIKVIQSNLMHVQAHQVSTETLYHWLGQLHALERIRSLPEVAKEHLASLPGEQDMKVQGTA